MPILDYAHIGFTNDGAPFVSGTHTTVEEIALDHIAHHWDATDIHREHPYLTLAQIHSALAYYYDHQIEMEREIVRGLQHVAEIQAKLGPLILACTAASRRAPDVSLRLTMDHHVPAAFTDVFMRSDDDALRAKADDGRADRDDGMLLSPS